MSTPVAMFETLHLLRPQWLWALALLPLLGLLWWRRQRRASIWQSAVDAHLLPHLLAAGGRGRGSWTPLWAALAYLLAVLALAGPSWRQSAQPLWQSESPLVIALDLSSASTAGDLPPSRLAQARVKVAQLLRERRGGQVGLLAFADDAYTVAPLTDDAANVALFLDALTPEVMPVDGHRPDRAITRAVRLMQQAGFSRGEILLLTHAAGDEGASAARRAADAGYRVLVLGLGTEGGAAYRSPDGSIRQSRLDAAGLRRLAAAGGGRYVAVTAGGEDLAALQVLQPRAAGRAGDGRGEGRAWQDEGYWLLPPLMLVALLLLRRRSGALVLLLCVAAPWGGARASDWWLRADQRAHRQLMQGVEAYRRGDFAAAGEAFRAGDDADAHYNRGNALAKAGRYPEALQAYDEALRRQPGMPDATANRRAVEAAMKQPPSKGGQSAQQPKGGQGSPPSPSAGQPQPSSGQGAPAPANPQQPPPGGKPPAAPPQAPPPETARRPADAKAQQAADAAQRQQMQRALQQRKGDAAPQAPAEPARETPAQRERRQANEAWLRRVPDEPGGLLREKFRLEYERRQQSGERGD